VGTYFTAFGDITEFAEFNKRITYKKFSIKTAYDCHDSSQSKTQITDKMCDIVKKST